MNLAIASSLNSNRLVTISSDTKHSLISEAQTTLPKISCGIGAIMLSYITPAVI
ncbi:hypothetical protein [Gloeocapsa sp. PCC 7428]|uniref:hypothetical protein n=1 Tax=Gloeocapsa sp. PCC 7428 TaxID=1173026 RepID=UPI000313FDF4|nr:hypothetical protein [Gloeocapsa sp. PCC 7428]